MPMTAKEMAKFLKKNGFEEVSQNGSHLKLQHPETKAVTIVPMHSKDLGKGMEQTILRQAGLKK